MFGINTLIKINMETILTKNGLKLSAIFIKEYPNGKLFFCQERIVITNLDNNELSSIDIIDIVEEIF